MAVVVSPEEILKEDIAGLGLCPGPSKTVQAEAPPITFCHAAMTMQVGAIGVILVFVMDK